MLIVKQCCRDNNQKFGQLNGLVGNKPQFQLLLLLYLDLFTTGFRYTIHGISIKLYGGLYDAHLLVSIHVMLHVILSLILRYSKTITA